MTRKLETQYLNSQIDKDHKDESSVYSSTYDGLQHEINSMTESNGNSPNASDSTVSSSESSSGLDTPRELQDPPTFHSSLPVTISPHKPQADASFAQWQWSSIPDNNRPSNNLAYTFDDSQMRETEEQPSNTEVERLKMKLVASSRQVDMSELELQTLRKQIIKESKRSQDLLKEIFRLKEERDASRKECENLKAFKNSYDGVKNGNELQHKSRDLHAILEETRQELNYEKDLNANLQLQLRKMQESNDELILAIQDLDEMLAQKNKEVYDLSKKLSLFEDSDLARCMMDEDEEQKALEKLVKEQRNPRDSSLLEENIRDLCNELEMYRRDKDELEMQMEQLALEYEVLKQEKHDLSRKLEQRQLQEQLKVQYESSSSFINANELEKQIENLENNLEKKDKELSDALETIQELRIDIKELENKLGTRSVEFQADLENITREKVEQEQRAIRAEEALQKTRWKNKSAIERIQVEFQMLSAQVMSAFDANQKAATKFMNETSDLRTLNNQLEESLQKANEELLSVRSDYEVKIIELLKELDLKSKQIEEMKLEIDEKSMQLEQMQQEKESEATMQEIMSLIAEITQLAAENSYLTEQAESMRSQLEVMKNSIKETEMEVERGNAKRHNLINTISLLEKEKEDSLRELNALRLLKDETEMQIGSVKSELELKIAQSNEMKRSLKEEKLEKENLKKQVVHLKGDLKKKEEAINKMDKKSSGRAVGSDGSRNILKNSRSAPVSASSKEIATLREKIKILQGQVQLKEAELESSINLHLEKEKELQGKIEDLQSQTEELNETLSSFSKLPSPKVAEDSEEACSKNPTPGEAISKDECSCCQACLIKENEQSTNRNDKSILKKEAGSSNLEDLSTQLSLLKERNSLMENELKDLQERYSDISLKFAEVEGERQQLVMALRSMKHAKSR